MSTGHRTKTVWMALLIDEDDDEAIVCWPGRRTPFEQEMQTPMVAFDETRMEAIRRVLPGIARKLRRPIRLVKFSVREDVETFGAKTASS